MLKGTPVTIGQAFSGRNNSFGFLRLFFAMAVLFAHSSFLGFLKPLITTFEPSTMAVAGFFGISGFLVTRSALRLPVGRFLWHRALRILPGLAVCVALTAFVLAPALWLTDGHPLASYPVAESTEYALSNLPSGQGRTSIAGLLLDTPYGRATHGDIFNGSLWTLKYEVAGYLAVAVAAMIGILRRSRVLVLGITVLWFAVLCWNYLAELAGIGFTILPQGMLTVPGLGKLLAQWGLWFGFMFLVGGLFELYRDRIRIDDRLGLLALAVLAGFLYQGVVFGPGLLAYAYLIIWLAARLPERFQRIGVKRDYSYGIYVYAFPVQQTLAKFGATAWGLPVYLILVLTVTVLLSAASWHLVEERALRAKNYEFFWRRKPVGELPAQTLV